MRTRIPRLTVLAALAVLIGACGFYAVRVQSSDPGKVAEYKKTVVVKSPTKAHLKDGSVALYANGFQLRNGTLVGAAEKYDLTRTSRTVIESLPLDEVANFEYYDKQLQPVQSTVATTGAIVATLGLMKALFGSCPTVYSLEGGGRPLLEAELFSHSIAPMFEGSDLDRIEQRSQAEGEYALLIANEALETHYINRLRLISVEHPPGFEAFPTPAGKIVLFGRSGEILEARSRGGADVREQILRRDDRAYRSDPQLVQQLTQQVIEDWLDITVKVPRGARQMTVALRVRNTLFATVLLYDVAMRSQGLRAIDWIGQDLANPLYAWRLHRWFETNFGIRMLLQEAGQFRPVEQFSATGPIAWHQVATQIPVPRGRDVLRLRLAFLPDNWAIDWVGVSFDTAPAMTSRDLAPTSVVDPGGHAQAEAVGQLRDVDDRYLITRPGDHYVVRFNVGAGAAEGRTRTYFLQSRGYYIEWLRRDWLDGTAGNTDTRAFEPNDAAIMNTARRWLEEKPRFEQQFFEWRIPLAGGAP